MKSVPGKVGGGEGKGPQGVEQRGWSARGWELSNHGRSRSLMSEAMVQYAGAEPPAGVPGFVVAVVDCGVPSRVLCLLMCVFVDVCVVFFFRGNKNNK